MGKIKITLDTNGLLRGLASGTMRGFGGKLGGKGLARLGLDIQEGSKLGALGGLAAMGAGAIIFGFGEAIMKQVLPNSLMEEVQDGTESAE